MRLGEIRKQNDYTQAQVAELLGMPTRTYQNYEREVREADSVVLCKLADIYGCTLDDLMGRTPPVAKAPELEILRLYDMLNDEGKAKLVDYADDLVKSCKYEKKKVQDNQIRDIA